MPSCTVFERLSVREQIGKPLPVMVSHFLINTIKIYQVSFSLVLLCSASQTL